MITAIIRVLAVACIVAETISGEFQLNVITPPILKDTFSSGIDHINIMPGKIKEEYTKNLSIKTLSHNKSGCRKYKEDFHDDTGDQGTGILLIDSDNCSLSTKIHYAQLSGASALFLKYIDDNIEEAEVDHSSFEGVRIPIFMLRASDADKIYTVLDAGKDFNNFKIELKHVNQINKNDRRIQIYMSSQPINNPMITFLKDLTEHSKLISNYAIEINFSLGFCKSCKDKKYMRSEPSCLSGGRYCVINSEFKSNELVKETLRQICIRDIHGTQKLIDYLKNLKMQTETLYYTQKFKEKDLGDISKKIMEENKIEFEGIRRCFDESFVKLPDQTNIDYDLDDNKLLATEQDKFLAITKHNIFPLVIINNATYDRTINIREFIRFGCQNHMFDCRGFRNFKKFFVIILGSASLIFVLIVIIFCRRIMKRKMDNELNIKVNEAIQKYLTVDQA